MLIRQGQSPSSVGEGVSPAPCRANGARGRGYPDLVLRSWPVDPQALTDLLKPVGVTEMLVGATQAMPGVFPEGFGISPRSEPRNELLGTVVTRPEEHIYAIGVTYYDRNDDGDNEDIYKIDLTANEMTPYMRGSFEEDYPKFANTHRAAKPYLRKSEEK